jgi:hypothetical protein
MNFEIDVLILFADHDNESQKGQTGWVTQFKKFLELMLMQVLGEKPKVLLKSEFDSMASPNLDNRDNALITLKHLIKPLKSQADRATACSKSLSLPFHMPSSLRACVN